MNAGGGYIKRTAAGGIIGLKIVLKTRVLLHGAATDLSAVQAHPVGIVSGPGVAGKPVGFGEDQVIESDEAAKVGGEHGLVDHESHVILIAMNVLNPRPLLHLEGATVFILALFAYHWSHGGWGWFALLFLAPDLSMIGYLANARVGAGVYNAIHTYAGPLALAGYAIGTNNHQVLLLGLIWIGHIGMDRMLGYGLKYPTRFKDTHLAAEHHVV